MKKVIVTGDISTCSAGSAPCPLIGTTKIIINGAVVVSEMDIPKTPFGICSILTAQAGGTPVPCSLPFPPPWNNASTTVITNGLKVATQDSTISCPIGGSIKIQSIINQSVKVEK